MVFIKKFFFKKYKAGYEQKIEMLSKEKNDLDNEVSKRGQTEDSLNEQIVSCNLNTYYNYNTRVKKQNKNKKSSN